MAESGDFAKFNELHGGVSDYIVLNDGSGAYVHRASEPEGGIVYLDGTEADISRIGCFGRDAVHRAFSEAFKSSETSDSSTNQVA